MRSVQLRCCDPSCSVSHHGLGACTTGLTSVLGAAAPRTTSPRSKPVVIRNTTLSHRRKMRIRLKLSSARLDRPFKPSLQHRWRQVLQRQRYSLEMAQRVLSMLNQPSQSAFCPQRDHAQGLDIAKPGFRFEFELCQPRQDCHVGKHPCPHSSANRFLPVFHAGTVR